MLKMKKLLASALVLTAVASVSPAATVYSTGFESPTFSAATGNTLVGQDGFTSAFVGTGGTNGLATVETAVKSAGAQGVEVDKTPNKDSFFYKPTSITDFTVNNFLNIQWDMRYTKNNGANTFGPFFGIDAYNGGTSRLGLGGVDSKTGELLIYDATLVGSSPQGINTVPSDAVVTAGVFHTYGLSFNFTTQRYFFFVDGTNYTPAGLAFANAASTFTDADFAALAASASGADQAATGTAYYDNFSVATGTSPLPEPTALSLIMGGIAAAGIRRRCR